MEDMGLVPIEANAAGCPVIAYRAGGVLDTVKENRTGIFFDEQSPAALARAMRHFEDIESQFESRFFFNTHVRQFSASAFKQRVQKVIDNLLGTR